MDKCNLDNVLRCVRGLVATNDALISDAQLLANFVERADGQAFDLLVRRHGSWLWGVCQRLLGDTHDADDAFQATFPRPGAAGCKPRRSDTDRGLASRRRLSCLGHIIAKRQRRQRRERALRADPSWTDQDSPELPGVLDEELNGLPEKYRVPVILCLVEGKTHDAAARELNWPLGTLKCRVARGRDRLRLRLARRGFALASALVLCEQAARAQRSVSAPSASATVASSGHM